MTDEPDNADAMQAQLESPSYRLAALDQDFLLSDTQRGVRFLLEYAKAEEALRAWSVRSTVVVFGSARVREDGPGRQPYWYAQAREFGRICSLEGGALDGRGGIRRDNVIATGGGPGCMEAANRGACDARRAEHRLQHPPAPRADAQSLQHAGADVPLSLFLDAQDAPCHAREGARRLPRRLRHNGRIVRTADAGADRQGAADSHSAVRQGILEKIINFQAFAEYGMVDPADLELFCFADTAQEIWDHLVKRGLLSGYEPKIT